MKTVLNIDMREATQLTREGRLKEALAILRGWAPDTRSTVSRPSTDLPTTLPRATTESAPSADAGRGPRPTAKAAPQLFERLINRARKPHAGFALPGLVPVDDPLPQGARFETRSYANASGRRDYKVYVPSSYASQPVPLVIMLHGCTQSPDDFAIGTRMNELAEEQTFVVAYPAQSQSANPSKCWNWFSTSDQQRDQGEPSLIAGITHEIMREFAIAPGRVFVAGLSAGGAAAAVMGATYPDMYAAVGVHSGLACGAARDMPSAFAAMKQGGATLGSARLARTVTIPAIVFHGDRDTTVHPINGDEVIAQAWPTGDLSRTLTRGASEGGVGYTRVVHSETGGRPVLEQWTLHGAGHAWSGGSARGSYTDPRGPDASREMLRFFLMQRP